MPKLNFNPRTPCGVRRLSPHQPFSPFAFQSTHPLRGATVRFVNDYWRVLISIHAPLAGCDLRFESMADMPPNFNPRTPCGVRPTLFATPTLHMNFNPRTPCGVRQGSETQRLCSKQFQSTHPLRGATIPGVSERTYTDISIHAPLAGCDLPRGHRRPRQKDFNPRTPCGVRPLDAYTCRCSMCISIHAPLAGCDNYRLQDVLCGDISIHAPLAGCDAKNAADEIVVTLFQSTHPLRGATTRHLLVSFQNYISIHAPLAGCDPGGYRAERLEPHFNPRTPCGVRPPFILPVHFSSHFNPRTPCGVRPTFRAGNSRSANFNPRTPCGVRPGVVVNSVDRAEFQSTHPLRGATTYSKNNAPCRSQFQSTHPLRGATSSPDKSSRHGSISIHAPLAGCDLLQMATKTFGASFQSTHPLRGATRRRGIPCRDCGISIHAPLAGCDSRILARYSRQDNFNPRTPCGVRLSS